ncbi:helix-turn-helix transcriptional regulator [Mycobacteroides chelonae]|uniref:helix-turn-helix transcriptional regulator n=1 Tax=Mycobacteroides chelonae TaxID=1774 RepID=UPI001C2B7E73|nr:YafY family protein [Mycobacteroides chelonae]MBV0920359.1 YafY family transcriptional regulator [Mycobacteroides chelonae]
MLETSTRLLRLLSLLQTRPDWTGPELARKLAVSTRTIRTDVERLRTLGYPIGALPGVGGGYRLGPGSSLPPLLLDDEETVAVAVGLRTAANGAVDGVEEASLRALAKLQQVMPSRLRRLVDTLLAVTAHIPGTGPSVDASVLVNIAAAIRANERLRFDYDDHYGQRSIRTVEPNRLVHRWGRWYLVAWDVDREDWRTFRADRVEPKTPTGPRFAPRPEPDGDVTQYLRRTLARASWHYRAQVLVHASADTARLKLPAAVTIEPLAEDRCVVDIGSDTPERLLIYLCLLDTDFEVLDAPEFESHLRTAAQRFARATGLRFKPGIDDAVRGDPR